MSPEPLQNRKTPTAQAAYWLNRNRSGEMSAEDVRVFNVWLEREPANRAAYARMEQVWSEVGVLSDDPAIMKSTERDVRAFDRGARMRLGVSVAAGVVLVGLTAWAVTSSGILADIGLAEQPRAQELRTSIGQRTLVTLRDGSIVTLDTDTIVRLRETNRERRVELERGRAFFQVAKDKSRPFIVAANGKTVTATGTAFDVRVDPNRFQVTLVEGRVRVQQREEGEEKQTADMRAGWRLNVGTDEQWRVAPVDVNKETTWHDGRLSFFRDPLATAVEEMNRYSDRKIVFRGEAPKVVVVGVFRTGDMDGFVKALELNKLARVASISDEQIELAPR